jgi:hypothetical protein
MSFGRWMVVFVSVLLVVTTAPARAAEPASTTLALAAPGGYAGQATTLRVALAQADGAPMAAAQVAVERRVAGAWTAVATVTTDEAGAAVLEQTLRRTAADNLWRASYAGDETHAPGADEAAATLRRRNAEVVLTGPARVVDERSALLRMRWTTVSGEPVRGTLRLDRRIAGQGWKRAGTLTTRADGRAHTRVSPRIDSRWRVRAPRLDWVHGDLSPVHLLDNVPPRAPIDLPAGAPEPRVKVPPQQRAVGEGANLVVTPIPDHVWGDMTGRTWHRGCPVGRAGLRLVRVNYWAYDGYRRRGEVVAAVGAADQIGGALREMYERGFPIRSMYRVDRFGWSARLQGGDDYTSMAAGNTSGFNCRWVVNRPGVRSPHSYGRSLDVNTWENPYRSATGLVPNSWWQPRSHPLVAWRSRSHPVVRIMRSHGLQWTYGRGDSQHFDARHHGRVVAYRGCLDVYCH